MRSQKIELLFVSGEFFSMEALNRLIRKKYPDAVIINYSTRKCWVTREEQGRLVQEEKSLIYTKNERVNYLLSPFIMLFNIAIIFLQIWKHVFMCRPKTIIADSYILPILVSFFKPLGLVKRTVYIAGDWHAANKGKKRLISYFANVFVFPRMDYLACKSSDAVLNYADKIKEARFAYWNKTVARKEKSLTFPFILKSAPEEALSRVNNNLLYLGLLKEDCGLDIAIRALKTLRQSGDFKILVIGPHSHNFLEFKTLAKQEGVMEQVEFIGFMEREKFHTITSQCFCGITLVKTENSYTALTFQGKIGDYLQYILPVIASAHVGYLSEVIEENRLGMVIGVNTDAFIRAVLAIHTRQKEFKKNIITYIHSTQNRDIDDLLGLN